jgi:AAA15 family ATPase/GTPase
MRIKKLHIQNYKSLVDFQLENPPQFCAFVGPNASGKSNIFEALEFMNYYFRFQVPTIGLFGAESSFFSYTPKLMSGLKMMTNNHQHLSVGVNVIFNSGIKLDLTLFLDEKSEKVISHALSNYKIDKIAENTAIGIFDNGTLLNINQRKKVITEWEKDGDVYENDYETFFDNFSRFFIGKTELRKIPPSKNRLFLDASNLAQIIGRIFQDKNKKEDFIEWVKILIPEFQDIQVRESNIDGSYDFFIYEKGGDKPFGRHLLSDGTKNILSLMAAIYQTNEPQFLCIEEPENGLHPQAIQFLIDFFREKCETEGHHIWLNTHSPTLVRCLTADELITVNKKDGQTTARQFSKEDAFNIKTDEAWLTNMLGGGVL